MLHWSSRIVVVLTSSSHMRLGFAVRILGRRGLRTYDARRPAQAPHLSVSLAHLRDVLAYLAQVKIDFYRMSSDLAPCVTYPALPQLQQQIDECRDELAEVGALARRQAARLSFHAPLHLQLAAEGPALVEQAHRTLGTLALLLDAMQLDADAVIVAHVGGLYGNLDAALSRWVRGFEALPEHARRRLVLEHQDHGAALGDVLRLHGATGVPVVFDYLHFRLNNPDGWSLEEALARALNTWPYDRVPKVHFSSPRTELRAVERVDQTTGRKRWLLQPPRPGHHADFINAWEFAAFMRMAAQGRDFDVMLEAKAADVALLRLRQDLARYEPEVAAWLTASRQIA
jgi:UV DNA damage endonuclease